jgi:hypothetical protein
MVNEDEKLKMEIYRRERLSGRKKNRMTTTTVSILSD